MLRDTAGIRVRVRVRVRIRVIYIRRRACVEVENHVHHEENVDNELGRKHRVGWVLDGESDEPAGDEGGTNRRGGDCGVPCCSAGRHKRQDRPASMLHEQQSMPG